MAMPTKSATPSWRAKTKSTGKIRTQALVNWEKTPTPRRVTSRSIPARRSGTASMGSKFNRFVEKLFSESFDGAQDERRIAEMIEKFPFMLRFSKHSESFSTACGTLNFLNGCARLGNGFPFFGFQLGINFFSQGEIENLFEGRAILYPQTSDPQIQISALHFFIDGAVRGHCGPAAIVIFSREVFAGSNVPRQNRNGG